MAAAVIVTIAAALQAGSVHLAMFLVARVLNGFGAGMIIANTPVYMSEISPAHTRGLLVSTQGISITLAYIVSSLVAFGFHFVDAAYQWRLQFVVLSSISLILVVTMYFIPESPRWLMVSALLMIRQENAYHMYRTTEEQMRLGKFFIDCIAQSKTLPEALRVQSMFKSRHNSKKRRYSDFILIMYSHMLISQESSIRVLVYFEESFYQKTCHLWSHGMGYGPVYGHCSHREFCSTTIRRSGL